VKKPKDPVKHLSSDAILKPVIRKVGALELKRNEPVYMRLIESIVSQQLSVKAADTIFGRFLGLYGGKEPTPQQILNTPVEEFRRVGFSIGKANYAHNVAKFELEHGMSIAQLEPMTDNEVITYLTQIKGVGRWTVEMLLMFVLAREDVFAIDDIGLQNAMVRLYDLNRKHKRFKKKVLAIAEAWKPFRTHASIYLWRSKAAVEADPG
jgi:DNA-3-methyladenine glycosylase II